MFKTYLLKRLLHDQHGATAVEYGLILALIVLALIGALAGVAGETVGMWNDIDAKSQAAIRQAGV